MPEDVINEERKINETVNEPINETTGEPVNNVSIPESVDKEATEDKPINDFLFFEMDKLKDMTPEQQANFGGKFGGGVGATLNGVNGAVIGSAAGATAARSLAEVQSGEQANKELESKVVEGLDLAGVTDSKSNIKFKDGIKFNILEAAEEQLPNFNEDSFRSVNEIDTRNPFSQRTTSMVRPLAYYLSSIILNKTDLNDPAFIKSTDNITAMLVNATQSQTDNIDSIYKRGREVAKKAGVSEKAIKNYFNNIKAEIPEDEAKEIRRGIDILYA